MSVRGLIGETWRLLRTHGRRMVLTALVFLVPAELAVAYASEDSATSGVIATLLLVLLVYPWVAAALLATLDNRARPPLEPYGRTVDSLPALVIANIAGSLAVMIGLVLLVVPGLLIAARWSAVAPLIVLDREGPFQSFETSNELVRGRTWPVVGAFVIVVLAAFAVAVPAIALATVDDEAWINGLAAAVANVFLLLPATALAYAVYRRSKAT